MITFDDILPRAIQVFESHRALIERLDWLVLNRDLYGRLRFIAPEAIEVNEEVRKSLYALYEELATRIIPHAYPPASGLLFESRLDDACANATRFSLEGFENVKVVDRLATESNWADIAQESEGAPRIVFYSIKGGVGRSTAIAACAWKMAQLGKRVLVLDVDLESPGLSSSLLPEDRQPAYGITDWLVEDLVDHAEGILPDMVATSNLSHDGEIYIVPAHGANPGEYVSKLGRVWMPKVKPDGSRESFSLRLQRMIAALEARIEPDVVLIDSRAGIDEVASSCVTDLGAHLVLCFALEGTQTWRGYQMVLKHWQQTGVTLNIRERIQTIAALVPEQNASAYLAELRESAYDLFLETLYDEISPFDQEGWSFDLASEGAPHNPWVVRWHRGFAALRTLHGRLSHVEDDEVRHVFGDAIGRILMSLGWGDGYPKGIDAGTF